jgi:hypothetical protein
MKKIFLILLIQFFLYTSYSQNVGIGTSTPHASAMLDVTAQNRGFLPPRITCTQRNTIQNPAPGLIIWCSDCAEKGEMQVFTGTEWMAFGLTAAKDSVARSIISTKMPSIITTNSAMTGGLINGDGGFPVLQRGVVWDTLPNPVIGQTAYTSDGTGTGEFNSIVTGLKASTQYFLRAYSTNVTGLTYANQISFTTNVADSLTVFLSKDSIRLNGFEETKITVKDPLGNDVTDQCTLLINNQTPISRYYVPSDTGVFLINANSGNSFSNYRTLRVLPKINSPFTKKILVEELTGTWVGYATRTIYKLTEYMTGNPNCIRAAIHGASSDPFQYQFFQSYRSKFSITGFPTVMVNRTNKWTESNSELDVELQKWAPLGLAISSQDSAGILNGVVKVKFFNSIDRPLKVVIAMVENGLIYPQINYYSPQYGLTPYLYGGVSPINDFVHQHTLRKTATDIFGDAIPSNVQVSNGEYRFPFSISYNGLTATNTTYSAVPANCAIVAFVVDDSPINAGVLNVQYAPVGVTKNYD